MFMASSDFMLDMTVSGRVKGPLLFATRGVCGALLPLKLNRSSVFRTTVCDRAVSNELEFGKQSRPWNVVVDGIELDLGDETCPVDWKVL